MTSKLQWKNAWSVPNDCNPNTQGNKTGGLPEILGQYGLHSKILPGGDVGVASRLTILIL